MRHTVYINFLSAEVEIKHVIYYIGTPQLLYFTSRYYLLDSEVRIVEGEEGWSLILLFQGCFLLVLGAEVRYWSGLIPYRAGTTHNGMFVPS